MCSQNRAHFRLDQRSLVGENTGLRRDYFPPKTLWHCSLRIVLAPWDCALVDSSPFWQVPLQPPPAGTALCDQCPV